MGCLIFFLKNLGMVKFNRFLVKMDGWHIFFSTIFSLKRFGSSVLSGTVDVFWQKSKLEKADCHLQSPPGQIIDLTSPPSTRIAAPFVAEAKGLE